MTSGRRLPLSETPVFPIFLKLAGRRVLMVGGGMMAEEKLPALVDAGAIVDIVAPEHLFSFQHERVHWHLRPFEESDLDGAWYVVSAAPSEVNKRVAALAEQRQLFVNAVDDLSVATAYLGAVVKTSGLTLAISSNGTAPALVSLLRQGLEQLLPEDLDRWVGRAKELRPGWKAEKLSFAARKPALLDALNALYNEKERG